MKANPIPPDESSWGRFDVLFENNKKTLLAILEDSAAHQQRSTVDQEVGAFYQSCMDESVIEKSGQTPLRPELERIAAIAEAADLAAEVARLHLMQVPVFFSFSAAPDPDHAGRNIADLDQGGLGLPGKDFYLRSDERSEEIRQGYVAHIAKMLVLAGVGQGLAAKEAADVMRIETALAKGSLDITSRRDPKQLVHRETVEQLAGQSPAFSYAEYFRAIQSPPFSMLNVSVPAFQKAFNDILANEPLASLRAYLAWHVISASARLLPAAFVNENFEFYGARSPARRSCGRAGNTAWRRLTTSWARRWASCLWSGPARRKGRRARYR